MTTRLDFLTNWAPGQFALADAVRDGLLRHRVSWRRPRAAFDLARFGMERMSFSPRQADVLICAGRLPFKLAPVIRRIWDQMPQPKWSISMGACASSGGIFDNYSMVQGIDTIIPVDVYVPGCPPRPEGLMYGIMLLQKKIKGESFTDDGLREEKLVEPLRPVPAARAGGRAVRAVRELGAPDAIGMIAGPIRHRRPERSEGPCSARSPNQAGAVPSARDP